jgi:hypothetical protein
MSTMIRGALKNSRGNGKDRAKQQNSQQNTRYLKKAKRNSHENLSYDTRKLVSY